MARRVTQARVRRLQTCHARSSSSGRSTSTSWSRSTACPRRARPSPAGASPATAGGKSANQAVAAARLGARVSFVGAVGDDEMGDEAVRELAAEGIDVSARRPGRRADRRRADRRRRGRREPDRRRVRRQRRAQRVETLELGRRRASCCSVTRSPRRWWSPRRGAAADAGWRVILNPAPARVIPDAVLAAHPILTPNASEAAQLTGLDDPEAAARALLARTGAPGARHARRARRAAASTARRRCCPRRRSRSSTPPAPATPSTARSPPSSRRARSLADAARFALAAAALSTRAPGARGGMPRREDVN